MSSSIRGVRCPARMILVIDLGLAALASLAIHSLIVSRPEALTGTLRRATTRYLPACMVAALVLLLGLWKLEGKWWSLGAVLTNPEGADAVTAMGQALRPWSPAVWVPLALAAATGVIVWWFLRMPRRRAWKFTPIPVSSSRANAQNARTVHVWP